MVMKKRLSKRVGTDRRAKNHKNAMEKNRKARKEARLHPQSKSIELFIYRANRKEIKKDPGIPNLWPFKDNLLKELQETKNKVITQGNVKKRPDKPLQSNPTMAHMAAEAKKRAAAFAENEAEEKQNVLANDPALSGNKDNSRKAYFKEFKKVLDAADVLLEVLDARDPLGCRTRNIERLILNDPNKRVILVLNKIDLIPTDVADAWIKYLRKDFPTIGFKSSTQNQRTNIGQSKIHVKNADTDLLSKSSTVGADSLIKLLKNYSRNQNIKTSLTVGVIGYPNVGKSSLINSLKRSKVCGVGPRPGFTKVAQEIHLDAKLKLLDCPGIVFGGDSKSGAGDVLLRNCIKVELLDDPISAVEYLLNKTKWQYVMMHYDLPAFSDVKGFLVELSRRRQFVKKNGILDLESTARMVLRDWNSGSIPYYTLPPKDPVNPSQNTQILSTWGQEFDLKDYDEAFVYDSMPAAFQNSMVMDADLDHPVDGDAELVTNLDEAMDDDTMEDEAPQLMIAPAAPAKAMVEVVEKKDVFLEGCQTNKDLKKKFKQERKANKKAEKASKELLDMVPDNEEGDGTEAGDDYDFGVLAQGLPMDE